MDFFAEKKKAFCDYLEKQWREPRNDLEKAMAYSLLAGGKRLRPILFLEAASLYRQDWQKLLPFAVGIEMIHTYSLVHDDLPAMDDDDFRRGRPTNHKVYGEAMAILAGDALLTAAFELITSIEGEEPRKLLKAANLAACHSGHKGMVYGQSLDIAAEGRSVPLTELKEIHRHKTGDLMILSLVCGGILGGANDEDIAAWKDYGENLGLAFQIVDDILDEEGSFEELGKTVHSDMECHKTTYITLLGLAKAKEAAKEAIETGNRSLRAISVNTEEFQALGRYLLTRKA
ncbi:MAG: polyprenyl synthetase family protein [Bacillota bacterium]|nr:polyprenyl synthetase family protein [Bacillota bacterium]